MKTKALKLFTLSLIFCLLFTVAAFAGDGDGTGGGQGEPLALLSSSPSDGQTDVSLDTKIVLGFSKNVINMTVKDNNMGCFSLKNENGETIAIQVIMADDQVEPEKKREIDIAPVNHLEAGTSYQLVISGALMSKSGVSLGNDIKIGFKTAGEKPQQAGGSAESAPAPAKEKPVPTVSKESTTASISTATTAALTSGSIKPYTAPQEEKPVKSEKTAEPSGNNTGYVFAAIALILAAGVIGYIIRRKKKK